jgi:hypothetical protein
MRRIVITSRHGKLNYQIHAYTPGLFNSPRRHYSQPTSSPWGTWLGANAMAAAMRAKRVTIWKVFMVLSLPVFSLLESDLIRRAAAPRDHRDGEYASNVLVQHLRRKVEDLQRSEVNFRVFQLFKFHFSLFRTSRARHRTKYNVQYHSPSTHQYSTEVRVQANEQREMPYSKLLTAQEYRTVAVVVKTMRGTILYFVEHHLITLSPGNIPDVYQLLK